jgi:hypothetical protein
MEHGLQLQHHHLPIFKTMRKAMALPITTWGISASLFLCVACSNGVSEPDQPGKVLTQRSESVAASVPGYQHVVGISKIHLGAHVRTDSRNVYDRTLGDDGVFATNRLNGMVIASQNANSPARTAGAFPGTMEDHTSYVLAYFQAAGVPADQVLGVTGSTKMTGSGAAGEDPVTQVTGYIGTVARSVGGFHVVESFADAEVNANMEVVRESVYWPEIPTSVLADAVAISAKLSESIAGPSYLASLPVQGQSRVTIHHTTGAIISETPFVSFASCDVSSPNSRTRHFDISGQELALPQEAPPAETPRPQ